MNILLLGAFIASNSFLFSADAMDEYLGELARYVDEVVEDKARRDMKKAYPEAYHRLFGKWWDGKRRRLLGCL